MAGEVDEEQRIDIELLEPGGGDLLGGEDAIVVLGEAIGVGPVTPASGGERELIESLVQAVLSTLHRDIGLAALELGETRHQDALDDEHRRAGEYAEQDRDECRDLPFDLHWVNLQDNRDHALRSVLKSTKAERGAWHRGLDLHHIFKKMQRPLRPPDLNGRRRNLGAARSVFRDGLVAGALETRLDPGDRRLVETCDGARVVVSAAR